MHQENWKKRYSFRLTEDDKEVYDFIEESSDSNSETIRKLLKFAILHIHSEVKHRRENELLYELIEMMKQMEMNQQNILNQIKNNVLSPKSPEVSKNKDEDDTEISIDKSVEAIFDSFGITE